MADLIDELAEKIEAAPEVTPTVVEPPQGFASVAQLLKKPVRTKLVHMNLGDERYSIRVKALGAKAYDELLAKHPPTKAQKAEGGVYNMDTFAPALLTECMIEPEISKEEATELWTSPDWSRGELLDLFFSCVEVNNKGLDVPFTESA